MKERIKAIISDIDGTLALRQDKIRSPYEFEKCETDLVNVPVADIVGKYKEDGYWIIIVTGRSREFHMKTVDWLRSNGIRFDLLFMRDPKLLDENGNMVGDVIVKEKIYLEDIKDKFDVLFVLDDRNRIVSLWRDKFNLICLQVANGDF